MEIHPFFHGRKGYKKPRKRSTEDAQNFSSTLEVGERHLLATSIPWACPRLVLFFLRASSPFFQTGGDGCSPVGFLCVLQKGFLSGEFCFTPNAPQQL